MRIKKVFQLSLFSVFITLHSLAQTAIENKVWTLEQCIDYALKNNISVKQSELNTELSQINLTQSEANLLPNLNGNFSHNYNFKLKKVNSKFKKKFKILPIFFKI